MSQPQPAAPPAWNPSQVDGPGPMVPPTGPPPPTWDYGLTQSVANGWRGPETQAPASTPVPLQPVVTTASRSRGSTRPSTYGVVFLIAAVICAGGVGFAVGRLTAPASAGRGSGTVGGTGFPSAFQGLPGAAPGAFASQAPAAPAATAAPADDTTADAEATPAVALASAAPDQGTPGGQGGPGQGGSPGGMPGGMGSFSIEGTVTAIDATGITLQLASGETTTVALGDDTAFHQRSAASITDLALGATVQVETAGGGFGRGTGGPSASAAPGGTSPTASDVTILEP